MSTQVLELFNAKENAKGDAHPNPFVMFDDWFSDAKNCPEIQDANAMHLATCSNDGRPSVRVVLLKNFSNDGFTFFTNGNSHKGQHLAENPQAEINFYWAPLKKQVRIFGNVTEVTSEDSDKYFASRHVISQMGACVSRQSSELESYEALQQEFENFKESMQSEILETSDGIAQALSPKRPSHWKGYNISPLEFEFWIDGSYRLHLRHKYILKNSTWQHTLLYP